MSGLAALLNYETIKLVTITNWKLGLIHRSIQILVLFYIAVYAIWYNKGYQKSSPVDGVLFSKVKGIAYSDTGAVVDAGDLVFPPTEPLALFITTRSLRTWQQEDTFCYDPDTANKCASNSDCVLGSATSNGAVQPTCNTTVGRCIIRGWCPVEVDDPQYFTSYTNLLNWTVYLRSSITYSVFQVSTDNANRAALGYNIFTVNNILAQQNWTDIALNGAIINVKIDWSCNLDSGVSNCEPVYQYVRTGTTGFNYRLVNYVPNINAPEYFSTRVYSKLIGVRFIFEIVGTGRRFDFATTIVTIGSGAAFFSLATIVTDYVIQYFHPRKQGFDHLKRQYVDLNEDISTGSSDPGYVQA